MGRLPGRTRGWPGCAVLFLIGAALWAVWSHVPSRMPAWGPYEFSWPIWLAVTLSGLWFQRGLSRLAPVDRPGPWRRIAFWAGLALIYGVTQTGFEYLAQRMFFINRLQHVAMHHVGPVLLALSAGGPAILAGAPGWVRRAFDSAPATLFMAFVQQPLVAAFLFVGLFWLWLIPPVHFAAMIDPGLYQVMNWSMAVDGILFWALVLDTRGALIEDGPDSGRPSGFVLTRHAADEEELLLIAVSPEHRGQGFGRELVEHLCLRARERGVTRIFLEMRQGNPAEQLYRSAGFEPIGKRPKYYRLATGGTLDAITFGRTL